MSFDRIQSGNSSFQADTSQHTVHFVEDISDRNCIYHMFVLCSYFILICVSRMAIPKPIQSNLKQSKNRNKHSTENKLYAQNRVEQGNGCHLNGINHNIFVYIGYKYIIYTS